MEGGHNKASSPEPTNDDAGTKRSYYECTFCKRGFTNAQALGGHMNIHRKDRARMQHDRMVSLVSRKAEENSAGYGYNSPYSNQHRTFYSPVSESLKNYSMYFPASSSGFRDGMGPRRQREMNLFGQELQLGVGVHFDGSIAVYEKEKGKDDEDEELDLELRLGHQP